MICGLSLVLFMLATGEVRQEFVTLIFQLFVNSYIRSVIPEDSRTLEGHKESIFEGHRVFFMGSHPSNQGEALFLGAILKRFAVSAFAYCIKGGKPFEPEILFFLTRLGSYRIDVIAYT